MLKKMMMAAVTATMMTACTVQVKSATPETITLETTPETTVPEPVLTAPPTTTTIPPTTTTERKMSVEDRYLADVYEFSDLPLYLDDAQIMEFGSLVCDFFRAGGTLDQFVETLYEAGMESSSSEDKMLAFAGAAGIATTWLCPSYGI